MRRKEREITDLSKIESILATANVCRLALHAEPYPYIVPLNYGYVRNGTGFALYFHCATEGEKLDHMRKNPHAAFEVEGYQQVAGKEAACSYTMEYESVIGQGVLSIVEGSEKATGMQALMRQLVPEQVFSFEEGMLRGVTVLRLDVRHITGKQNRKDTP